LFLATSNLCVDGVVILVTAAETWVHVIAVVASAKVAVVLLVVVAAAGA